ncbi:hypothetical protein BC826DRAFT_976140 [Russula brevipes]|nr:hypothetical protein BC826DRAFT_976140 [Russula brevipes]
MREAAVLQVWDLEGCWGQRTVEGSDRWGERTACTFVAHAPTSSPLPAPPTPLVGGQAARGRGVGSVDGQRAQSRVWIGVGERPACSSSSFSGGPSGGGTFVAHTPKSSPSPPPPPPLIGGQAARAVEGSDRCRGTDGMGSSSSFSSVGVGAREMRVLRGVSDWGAAREDDKPKGRQRLVHTMRVPHAHSMLRRPPVQAVQKDKVSSKAPRIPTHHHQ